jgi:hypothetical protein
VITYTGHDANGIASYDVRYRTKGSKGKHHHHGFRYPGRWQATTHTKEKLRIKAGTKYCVSARSRDVAGNTSPWSHDHCTKAV